MLRNVLPQLLHIPFQLLDCVRPKNDNYVCLSDLKKSGVSHRFFNAFTNCWKFYEQEAKEGLQIRIDSTDSGSDSSIESDETDWERFCREEYDLLTEDLSENSS